MIELDEWEENTKKQIKNLEGDYNSIVSLSYRIKAHAISNIEDERAVETVLILISKEIEKLKGELYIHQLLKNSDIIIP